MAPSVARLLEIGQQPVEHQQTGNSFGGVGSGTNQPIEQLAGGGIGAGFFNQGSTAAVIGGKTGIEPDLKLGAAFDKGEAGNQAA